MNGFTLVALLCDHWRKTKAAHRPVEFVLDIGGRGMEIELIGMTNTPKGTRIDFRRIP